MNFNERVHALVKRIPPGRVISYGRVAFMLGVPRGARAVGWALHALPAKSAVPWHRVVNAHGQISPRGEEHTPALQRALLEAEGVEFGLHEVIPQSFFVNDPSELLPEITPPTSG
ncbi:MAG: MGMT family protein [Anaerolinea sp.]|nr:MGMT family protein [Anaerolinea sp.]CAG1011381.1 DNA base-flipping protein [Anaerolineae bacterium]